MIVISRVREIKRWKRKSHRKGGRISLAVSLYELLFIMFVLTFYYYSLERN